MRLSAEAARIIRQTAEEQFGAGTRVLLFGSRADDRARGGDIDLCIQPARPVTQPGLAVARFEARLISQLGDQKIDVVLAGIGEPASPIHQAALSTGILL